MDGQRRMGSRPLSALLSDADIFGSGSSKPKLLSDDDIFGSSQGTTLSDDDVFGGSMLDTAGNLARGIGERAAQLGGGLLRTVGGVVETGTDAFERHVLGRPDEEVDKPSRGLQRTQAAAAVLEGAKFGYEQMTSWEDFKKSPLKRFIPFALEQGLISAPDMAAAVATLPLYVAARTGEIGQERAKNEGAENATAGDLLKALPASIVSSLLERFGARGMFGLDEVAIQSLKQLPKEAAKAGFKEGATETAQEAVEYGGTNLGTEKGVDGAELADRMAAAAVGGAGFGGTVRTATAATDLIPRRTPQVETSGVPEGATPADTLYPQEQPSAPQLRSTPEVIPEAPKISLPEEPAASVEVDRPDSPRLTPEDRASPIPNDLIDDGKAMIEQATAPETRTPSAPSAVAIEQPQSTSPEPAPAPTLTDAEVFTPAAPTAPTGDWLKSLAGPARESTLAMMREIDAKVQRAYNDPLNRVPYGTQTAGSEGSRQTLLAGARDDVLRSIREGKTPDQAIEIAKAETLVGIETHNRHKPRDTLIGTNWEIAPGAYDSDIEHTARMIADAPLIKAREKEAAEAPFNAEQFVRVQTMADINVVGEEWVSALAKRTDPKNKEAVRDYLLAARPEWAPSIAAAFNPPKKGKAERAPLDLIQFLAAEGGLSDFQGELKSLDLSRTFVPGMGRLVREKGMKLDRAREKAEQAGYIGLAGDYQTTSVADLLDAIERNMRGERVYSREDAGRAEDRRASVEGSEDVARRDDFNQIVKQFNLTEAEQAELMEAVGRGEWASEAIFDIEERRAIAFEAETHDNAGQGERPLDIPFDTAAEDRAREEPSDTRDDREGSDDGAAGRSSPLVGEPRPVEQAGRAEPEGKGKGELAAKRSTYVRRNAEGAFEYGTVTRAKNFRKQSDKFEPKGTKPTVAQAERARAELEAGKEPMFSRKGEAFRVREQSAGIETELVLTDAFVEKAEALSKTLRSSLDQMGLKDVSVRVSESIRAIINGQSFAADGRYFKGLIDVALDGGNPLSTLDHEAIHAMRRMGLFSETEWSILSRKSKKEWMGRYKIEDGYSGFPEWAQIEEGIAHAYADWSQGARMDGLIARSFKRIKAMLKALAQALTRNDFRTAEDIFQSIAAGETGQRQRTGGKQAKAAAFGFPTEKVDTLDGPRDQLVIPGAEKISDKTLAERKMAAPLKAGKAQKDASGLPLFGDEKDQLSLFQSAWHGTPHDFDKFRLDKIGTGEGAQAFGYGLYFAGKKGIAEFYQRKLSASRVELSKDGKTVALDEFEGHLTNVAAAAGRHAASELSIAGIRLKAETIATNIGEGVKEGDSLSDMKKFVRDSDWSDLEKDMWRAALNEAETYTVEKKKGRLFKVTLPEDGDLLVWEKPLAEQPAAVKKAIGLDRMPSRPTDAEAEAIFAKARELGVYGQDLPEYTELSDRIDNYRAKGWEVLGIAAAGESIFTDPETITGEEFYHALTERRTPEVEARIRELEAIIKVEKRKVKTTDEDWVAIDAATQELHDLEEKGGMGDAAASEYLRNLGIPGHRYLDGGSRSAGDGTYNYVIYDDSRIEIEERFKLRRAPKTAQESQAVMQGFIARGQPIDRAIRLPFDLLGGLDESGRWNPGKRVTDKIGPAGMQGGAIGGVIGAGIGTAVAGPVGTAAGAAIGGTVGAYLLGGKIASTGRFGWLHGIAENARRGLVDRYGLDPEYIKADRGRQTGQRAVLQQAEEILKVLSNASVGTQEAKVLQGILTGENIDDKEMGKIAVPIRKAIDDLGAEAVSLGLISAESFERNRGAYLHRVYLKNEIDQGTMSGWVAKKMASRRTRIIGDQMKGRGLFWEVPTDRLMQDVPGFKEGTKGTPANGDKFRVIDEVHESGEMIPSGKAAKATRRVYLPADKPVPKQYQNPAWRDRGTWEVRGTGKNVTLWRDYTKDERQKMGEIVDARYTIARTFMLMANDLSTGRFYKEVAENENWARSSEPATGWRTAEEYSGKGGRYWTDPEIAWVKVPDTVISDTGGKKRWGALSGKYVRAEIWRDLNETDIAMTPGTWRKLLTQWKLNKTARNPVVHMNNVMSNMMFMDLADVRMQDFVSGVRAYYEGNKDYIEARDNGAFGQDMMSQEIRDNVLKPILEEIAKDEQGGTANSLLARAGKIGKVADILWTWAKKTDAKMISAYQIEDELFRMATYLRRRSLGESPEMAAQNARDQFLNYDIKAPWINAARNSVFPFIAYTYRAVPKLAENMAHRPWKMAKYFAIAYAVNALAYLWDDGEDGEDGEERERASLRNEEQGWTWLGTPRMLRMPFRDSDGLPVFLDVRRWVPAGDIFDTEQGSAAFPIPAPINFGGPFMLAAEFLLNRQAFTGNDITNELTDDNADKAENVADWAWKAWMPSAPWVPNSWYFDKIWNAATGASDAQGRDYSLPQALINSIGIKAKSQDVESGLYWHNYDFKKVQFELRAQMRRLGRSRERNLISQAEYDRQAADITEKFSRLEKNTDDFARRSQPVSAR